MVPFKTLALFLLSLAAATAADPRSLLEEINLARTEPRAYAEIMRAEVAPATSAVREALAFLQRTSPLPPLTLSEGMSAGAALHVTEQGARGLTGHNSPDRSRPWDRINRYGTWSGAVGENIFYGKNDARSVVLALIIDEKVRGRGHRKNIFGRQYNVAGTASGMHATFGRMWVIDFAGSYAEAGSFGSGKTVAKL